MRGVVEVVPQPTCKWSDFISGGFQPKFEEYMAANFGFRPEFTRLNNQREYWLYGKLNVNGIVIGKQNYLYEQSYIDAYLGNDFVGDSIIQEKVRKLQYAQEKLQEKGKNLLVVFAPGKGSFYPEYIPNEFSKKVAGTATNYDSYVNFLSKSDVNFIDCNSWFRKMKSTSKYPLYPKAGIHWSVYGEYLAQDSILKKIEKLQGVELPRPILDEIELSVENKDGDFDLGEALNLIHYSNTFPMAYPKYHVVGKNKSNTKVMFVSDSFYWGMFYDGASNTFYGGGNFWYYNKEIFHEGSFDGTPVDGLNIKVETEKNNVIVILSTDANLKNFGWEYIEELYNAYQKDQAK